MPGLMDDGPGRVVVGFPIVEQDWEKGDSWQEAAAAEHQNAAAVSASAFRGHHQHGKASILSPAPVQQGFAG